MVFEDFFDFDIIQVYIYIMQESSYLSKITLYQYGIY